MEARKILIIPLPLLWHLSNFLLDRLGKKRVTSIIRTGKSKLVAEVMGDGFPAILQALSRSGPSIMTTPLLVRPLWQGFVVMLWWSRRCPRIFLENVPWIHVSCRKYPCMNLTIINSIVFSSLSPPVIRCTLWFSRRHTWGQVSPGLVCTWECKCLRWLAAGISPPWSSTSKSRDFSLNRNGVGHGAGWECQFPFEGRGRRGRRWSPKGTTGYGFAGLLSWKIVVGQRCPRRGRFHAEAVLSGMRTIDGIVSKCLGNKTYHTIPKPMWNLLRKKLMTIGQPDEMAWDGKLEPLEVPTRWTLLDSRYKPVTNWTYWPVLVSFNNWNIIQMS